MKVFISWSRGIINLPEWLTKRIDFLMRNNYTFLIGGMYRSRHYSAKIPEKQRMCQCRDLGFG